MKKVDTKKSNEEIEVKKVAKKRTRKELATELRKKRDDLEVEILNISTGGCSYYDRNGESIFDLVPGQSVSISLGELQTVCQKTKVYFVEHYLVITDLYSEEYTLEEILSYLGLTNIYRDIQDSDEDYLRNMLVEEDDDEFDRMVSIKDTNFIKTLASKAIFLHAVENEEISRGKERVLISKLKLETLFPE